MQETLSARMRRMALAGHANTEAAVAAAKRNGNVAFVAMSGTPLAQRYLTCSRQHVSARITSGQAVRVLADFEGDK